MGYTAGFIFTRAKLPKSSKVDPWQIRLWNRVISLLAVALESSVLLLTLLITPYSMSSIYVSLQMTHHHWLGNPLLSFLIYSKYRGFCLPTGVHWIHFWVISQCNWYAEGTEEQRLKSAFQRLALTGQERGYPMSQKNIWAVSSCCSLGHVATALFLWTWGDTKGCIES